MASTDNAVGESIPAATPHAVSVSLPTWSANVGYEEGQQWVLSKMKTGYPRFFVHKSIQEFSDVILRTYGRPGEKASLFPSRAVASRCVEFLRRYAPPLANDDVRIIELALSKGADIPSDIQSASPGICAILFPEKQSGTMKTFWQHTGEGISSRRAEFAHHLFNEGLLCADGKRAAEAVFSKGPRRYRSGGAKQPENSATDNEKPPAAELNGKVDGRDSLKFVEERFGRNLDFSMVHSAKAAIRKRIIGSLTINVDLKNATAANHGVTATRQVPGLSESDVFLYPCGMSAIFNTHQALMAARGELKSISYGFPYIDTLKILEKFGPGCLFYGHGSGEELSDIESMLESGERFLALFCEFPGNPLLNAPDLLRIRQLADKYDFLVVVDETIGNFLNVHVLPQADVVVSSLTKIFSGDSNVMGGSAILNPQGRHYSTLQKAWLRSYEDNLWAEDALFLERNSRDFVSRNERINTNAEAICDVLRRNPRVKRVNYPKYSPTRRFYEQCRTPNGGYGGLLSATFHSSADAVAFFDNLETAKGPSLGTNFTLSSPYVILAHYTELDWAMSFGVETDLIRFSVGLEDTEELVSIFRRALAAMETLKAPSVGEESRN